MRYIHRELTVDTHCVDREHIVMPIRDIEGTRYIASLEDVKLFLEREAIRQEDIIEKCSFLTKAKDNLKYKEQNFSTDISNKLC